ncbi:MAG: cysteine peptidase family C39 domain-containing protein [Pseudohongiella sp.]|nr:cysteine peptidase family C39 domain-containing protein [Pseudohongiella sp.]
MKLKRVIQKDSTGCGIACVAMIAGISYGEAKRTAIAHGIVKKRPPYYTTSGELTELLRKFHRGATKGRKLSKWESLDRLSIVGINFSSTHGTWHWVIYVPGIDAGFVLDPRKSVKTHKRTDFSRMRPRSYIAVTPPDNQLLATNNAGA